MGKRNRNRRPARRAPFRNPKPVILIVCEGEVTEPEYLKGLTSACRNPRVRIEIHKGGGAPKTIVEIAKKRKKFAEKNAKQENDENLTYDEVWCVFDVDQHPNIRDARQMARDNQIALAISNPCVELWLYLHFADQPGPRDRSEFPNMLKRYVPGYDKHVTYADYAAGFEDAARRARKLDDDAELDNDDGRNPTTGLWRLAESIRKGSRGDDG